MRYIYIMGSFYWDIIGSAQNYNIFPEILKYWVGVRRPNVQVATKSLLLQQAKKYWGRVCAMFAHGSAFLQLFLVVGITLQFQVLFITKDEF